MSLQASNIADLISVSLPELGRLKFTDLASSYQQTIALKRIFRQKKTTFDSGPTVRFNVMFDTNGSARSVPLGFTATVEIPNVMTFGEVPWRGITFNWAIEGAEEVMNSGASKIVDIMQVRRMSAFGDFIVKMEQLFWASFDSTNDLDFFPITYWIVKSNTAATAANNDGFNGTVPSGVTTVAALSPTTFDRWRNYATQYATVTKEDLIRKMRRAALFTDFMPLVDDMPVYNLGDDYGWYTNYAVLGTLEEILEGQNENLGDDIAPMDGKVTFRRAPVTWVKELEKDTTNPVYGINWGELFAMRLREWWMKEIPVPINPNQPTVHTVHNVSRLNTMCRNRRRQAVLATDTTMP
jgi:hypothetical protein